MLRIISQRLHPVTQLRRMNAKSSAARAYDTPRSLTSFTASSLNSRVNFRLSMTHLLLHKTPNLVSSEPGAAHKALFPRLLEWIPNKPDSFQMLFALGSYIILF